MIIVVDVAGGAPGLGHPAPARPAPRVHAAGHAGPWRRRRVELVGARGARQAARHLPCPVPGRGQRVLQAGPPGLGRFRRTLNCPVLLLLEVLKQKQGLLIPLFY